ncbi:uncharacterized protein LOC135371779 isoform X2 [Ornithodoros turicata]|uniref:uncharacterized protein LOC135371779 isoform X2 n=1 Tax=Ornithodoros turicata TaxID=34597 RepID=UPI00313A27AA
MLMHITLLLACLFTWQCDGSENNQIAWNALQREKGFFLMKRSVTYEAKNKCVYLIKRRIISTKQRIEAHYGFLNGDHYSEEACVMQAPRGGNGTVVQVTSPILGGEVLTFDVKYFDENSGCLVLVGIDEKVSGRKDEHAKTTFTWQNYWMRRSSCGAWWSFVDVVLGSSEAHK